MRGRLIMMAAGMKMGQARAQQQVQQAEAMKKQGAEDAMKQQAQNEALKQQGAAEAAQMAPSTQAPGGGADITQQLQQLASLHQSGILTAEEFAAAKKKLLGV